MNSEIDARKAVSSLTLFRHVAQRLAGDDVTGESHTIAALAGDALAAAVRQGYEPCAFTLARLDRPPHAT
jgi:hypothetical protein